MLTRQIIQIRNKILPRIIRTENVPKTISSFPLGNDVSIIYQINVEDPNILLMNSPLCLDFGIDEDELDNLARKNLAKRKFSFTKIKSSNGWGKALKVRLDGTFTASHLLRRDLWYRATEVFADNRFYAAIPTPNTLFLYTCYSQKFAVRMHLKMEKQYQDTSNKLSKRPFLIVRDGICSSPLDKTEKITEI